MRERLERLFAAVDAANACDPIKADSGVGAVARSILYGRRMSRVLAEFMPDASEHLRIAARAQHIER